MGVLQKPRERASLGMALGGRQVEWREDLEKAPPSHQLRWSRHLI